MGLFDFLFGEDEKKKTPADHAVALPSTPSIPETGQGSSIIPTPRSIPKQQSSIADILPVTTPEQSSKNFGDLKRESTVDAVHEKLQQEAKASLPREDAVKLVEADPSIVDQHFKQFGFTGERKKQLEEAQAKKVQENLRMSFETKRDPVTGNLTVDDDVKEEVINAFYRQHEQERQNAGGVRSFGKGLKDELFANLNFFGGIGEQDEENKRLGTLDADTSDLYREFIRTVDPAEAQLLDQFGQADTSLARGAGQLTGILGTAIIPGGAASKTIRALPLVARLRQGTRAARLAAVVMENVAFDLTAQGFFSVRNGENMKEFTKNVASNPSMLLPYHRRWHLVAGFAADTALGKALGLSTMDALQNATIGAGAGFLQRFQTLDDLGLRQLRNRAKEGMDQINAVARTQNAGLADTIRMEEQLVKSLEKEARLLGFKPNETKSIFGEGRLLKRSNALPGGENLPDTPRQDGSTPELPDAIKPPEEVVQLRPGDIEDIPDSIPQQDITEANELLQSIFPKKEANPVTKLLSKDKAATKRGIKEVIGDPGRAEAKATAQSLVDPEQVANLKDINSITGGRFTDVYNNTKKVFGDKYKQVKEALLDPLDDSKSRRVDFLDQQKSALKENVTEKFGIKRKSRESAAIQEYGELAKIAPERIAEIGETAARAEAKQALVEEFGAERAQQLIDADSWFRSKYNELIDEVNKQRAIIYPNKPPIPKLKNYYRHFQEISGTLSGIRNAFASPANIDPNLVGISEFTTPKSRYLSFGQKRKGNVTDYDAVSGFLNYIESASYAIHIDQHINKFHAFREALAGATEDSKNLNNYTEFLFEFANDLAGKTNPVDRAVLKAFGEGARKWLTVLDNVGRRVRSNTVLGNAKSAISQVFNLPQAIAETNPRHLIEGMFGTFRDIHTGDPVMAKSSFLKERYAKSFYEGFEQGMIENVEKQAKWMLQVGDEIATKYIWRSKYAEAVQQGVENPVRYADAQTRNLVAGRGIGEVPLAQKSKLIKLIAPFQLEVGNAMRLTAEKVQKKQWKQLATLLVANTVMNEVSEKITGGRVVYDPINALLESIQNAENDDSLAESIYFGLTRQGGELLSNVPLGQTFANAVTGGDDRFAQELFGDSSPTRFGPNLISRLVSNTIKTATTAAKEGLDSDKTKKAGKDLIVQMLTSLGTPFGGNQIRKTLEGAQALDNGEVVTKDGKHMFDVNDDPVDIVRTLLFGKYSTKEAREYFRGKKGKEEEDAIQALFGELFQQSSEPGQILDVLGIPRDVEREPVQREKVQREKVQREPVQRQRK